MESQKVTPTPTKPTDKWAKKYFEENLLDGDKVEDCGMSTLAVDLVWEVVQEILRSTINEVKRDKMRKGTITKDVSGYYVTLPKTRDELDDLAGEYFIKTSHPDAQHVTLSDFFDAIRNEVREQTLEACLEACLEAVEKGRLVKMKDPKADPNVMFIFNQGIDYAKEKLKSLSTETIKK